jgi:hypothetical protein
MLIISVIILYVKKRADDGGYRGDRIVPMTFSCLVKTEGNRVPTWLSCSQIGLKYASGISIFFKCTSTAIIIGGTFY